MTRDELAAKLDEILKATGDVVGVVIEAMTTPMQGPGRPAMVANAVLKHIRPALLALLAEARDSAPAGIPGPTESTEDDIDVYDVAINGTGMTRDGWRGVCRAGLNAVFAVRAERYGRPSDGLAPAPRPEATKPTEWVRIKSDDDIHVARVAGIRYEDEVVLIYGHDHSWLEVTDPAVAARLREFAGGPDVLDLTGGGEG